MSSFTRTIQRTLNRPARCRAPHYLGRGSKLGVTNAKAKDRIAREHREKLRAHPTNPAEAAA